MCNVERLETRTLRSRLEDEAASDQFEPEDDPTSLQCDSAIEREARRCADEIISCSTDLILEEEEEEEEEREEKEEEKEEKGKEEEEEEKGKKEKEKEEEEKEEKEKEKKEEEEAVLFYKAGEGEEMVHIDNFAFSGRGNFFHKEDGRDSFRWDIVSCKLQSWALSVLLNF